MMKKRIIGFLGCLVLLLCCTMACQPSFAQYRYRVKYDMLLDMGESKQYAADFYAGGQQAFFRYRLMQGDGEEGIPPVDALNTGFQFNIADTGYYFIFSDRMDGRVIQLDQLPGEAIPCLILESMPSIGWKFTGQYKLIGQYDCLEAKGHFMGRDYTVWCSDQLPGSFGPWKLHGLPGMVLEAYDASGEVRFYAKKIEQVDIPLDSLPFSMAAFPYPVLDRAAYIRRFNRYLDVLERRMMTKFGRGFRVKAWSSPIKSIEIYDQ